jgi:hypothetical protein
MEQLIAAVFTLFTSIVDVPAAEALVGTAKDTRLTVEVAAQHVAAARFAAVFTHTDPDLLLAIAHHESRYESTVVGPLVRGKRACGVLQHVPITAKCPEPSILRDYVNGAKHLAEWIHAQRGDIKRALIGYAGGYALLELCDRGEAPRACSIASYHLARAKHIQGAREIYGTKAARPRSPNLRRSGV